MAESAYVVFTPSGKRGRFPIGASILACARQLGVDIDSVCGGRGICGRCQVVVGEGEFAKHGITSSAESLEPLTEPERKYDGRKGLAEGRRLGCHARLLADVAIDLSGRAACVCNIPFTEAKVGSFDVELVEEFLRALANSAKLNLHVNVRYGRNNHHMAEAVFKALARALSDAVQIDERVKGVPSTKGTL